MNNRFDTTNMMNMFVTGTHSHMDKIIIDLMEKYETKVSNVVFEVYDNIKAPDNALRSKVTSDDVQNLTSFSYYYPNSALYEFIATDNILHTRPWVIVIPNVSDIFTSNILNEDYIEVLQSVISKSNKHGIYFIMSGEMTKEIENIICGAGTFEFSIINGDYL